MNRSRRRTSSATRVAAVCVALLVLRSPSPAVARLLGVAPFFSPSLLIELNTNSGAATTIGDLGRTTPIGLTAAPSGTLYTVLASEPGANNLYVVDPLSGDATAEFSFTTPGRGIVEGDLAAAPDGQSIYLVTQEAFYRINLVAQTLTEVGFLKYQGSQLSFFINIDGLSFRGEALYGLVTEDNGQLGGVLNDHLVTLDLTTLELTDVGPLGVDIGFSAGLAYDPFLDAFFAAGDGNSNLYRLNPTTGAATLVGAHNVREISGLTFVVPEPNVLALSALAAVAVGRARRKRATC